MSQPWGLSGPQFLAVYAAAYAVLLATSLVVRRRLARGPNRPVDADHPLTIHEIAYLSGGPARVVDASVVALIDAERIRVSRGGTLTHLGGSGEDPVQQAVLRSFGKRGTVRLSAVAGEAHKAPEVAAVAARLHAAGLLLIPEQRLRLRWLTALPMVELTAVGIARWANGLRLDRPVGYLVSFLVISVITTLNLAFWVPASSPTTAGRRAVKRLRGEVRSAGRGIPEPMAQASPYLLSAAALGVALDGEEGLPDDTLRHTLFSTPSSSGGSSSSSGGDSSSSSSGGCGGGCGG